MKRLIRYCAAFMVSVLLYLILLQSAQAIPYCDCTETEECGPCEECIAGECESQCDPTEYCTGGPGSDKCESIAQFEPCNPSEQADVYFWQCVADTDDCEDDEAVPPTGFHCALCAAACRGRCKALLDNPPGACDDWECEDPLGAMGEFWQCWWQCRINSENCMDDYINDDDKTDDYVCDPATVGGYFIGQCLDPDLTGECGEDCEACNVCALAAVDMCAERGKDCGWSTGELTTCQGTVAAFWKECMCDRGCETQPPLDCPE